jgi:hypothetical protein
MDQRELAALFKTMSLAEKIAWCEDYLRYIDQVLANTRRLAAEAASRWEFHEVREYEEIIRQLEEARPHMEFALYRLHNPTLWQRINMWVNERAAAEERKKQEKQARRNAGRCQICGGRGSWVIAEKLIQKCPSCGGSGRPPGWR